MKTIIREVQKMESQNLITLYGEIREQQIDFDFKISEQQDLKFSVYYNDSQDVFEVDCYTSEVRNLNGKFIRGIVAERYWTFYTGKEVIENAKKLMEHYIKMEQSSIQLDLKILDAKLELIK